MKQYILLILIFLSITSYAQPPRRIAERNAMRGQYIKNAPQGVSYREFPTAPDMPQDVMWRRDIYRKLDLSKEKNAVLYYPQTPHLGRYNLFTYLMKCLLRRQLKAYKYDVVSGVENFSSENEISAKQIMDEHKIFYEVKDGRMHVEDIDLSLRDVRMYYIKESVYYDQHTSTFRTQVIALCPVIVRGDKEFGGSDVEYPICWIKFSDASPLLSKLMMMASSLNNAATISASDYFTMNLYQGDIYNVVNLQDKLLFANGASDSTIVKTQKKIESQLSDFRKNVWGKNKKSLQEDSLKVQNPKVEEEPEKHKHPSRRGITTRRTLSPRVKKISKSSHKQSSSRSSSTFSVRRARH